MILYGDEEFASAISKLLNISRQTASAKLNGKNDFTQSEIVRISNHYHLSAEDIKNIFIGEYDESNESVLLHLKA
jgi:plasmid maintenance system antidote protein VapI